MTPWRTAVVGGLLYGVPLGFWLLYGLDLESAAPDLFHRTLLWAQALSLVLLLPALTGDARPGWVSLPSVLLVIIPWPLLSLLFLTRAIPLEALLAGQIAMVSWGILLNGLLHLMDRSIPQDWRRTALGGLQGSALLTLLVCLAPALQELGL